ncbi:MAG: hypothetical protein JNM85_01105 [Chthonomonas sp.]|nr:hypothetical protein [Chthonomonas sp.]
MSRLGDLFRFSRPAGPGFGLSKGYYLTVMVPQAQLPTPRQLVNPKGEGGAVPGFIVPEVGDKSALDVSLSRGHFAVASSDRKSVLRMTVFSRDEARFDPDVFLRSEFAQRLDPELRSRLAATWSLIQLTLHSHDAAVVPTLMFTLQCAHRAALLTQGVIADPLRESYELPEEMVLDGFAIDQHVGVVVASGDGMLVLETRGISKFALPEIRLSAVPPDLVPLAQAFLLSLAATHFQRGRLNVEDHVGAARARFLVATAPTTPGQTPKVLELVPLDHTTVADCLAAWREEHE